MAAIIGTQDHSVLRSKIKGPRRIQIKTPTRQNGKSARNVHTPKGRLHIAGLARHRHSKHSWTRKSRTSLEETYHRGVTLDLYAWELPALPTSTERMYEAPPTPTKLTDRYNQSIAKCVDLPSTPPTVSVTLERRMDSSMRRVAHVWMARVKRSSSPAGLTLYPPLLVAKVFDPVFFDDDETMWDDPFYLCDLAVACEVEAYRRLEPLQGTEVPRFYGYFAAPLRAQHNRTVHVILLEAILGRDLRAIVPPDATENICPKHKNAIVDAALRLHLNILTLGVHQLDMKSRNVILRPQTLSGSGMHFCDTAERLALEVDCDDLHMVMVDFEMVDSDEPDPSFSEPVEQRAHIEQMKSMYLQRWVENALCSTCDM